MFSFRSTLLLLAVYILLSQTVPPEPKAEITAKHRFVFTFGPFVLHFQSPSSLKYVFFFLVDACIFVCVIQLISFKLVMMVKVPSRNEPSCVASGYIIMLLAMQACLTGT